MKSSICQRFLKGAAVVLLGVGVMGCPTLLGLEGLWSAGYIAFEFAGSEFASVDDTGAEIWGTFATNDLVSPAQIDLNVEDSNFEGGDIPGIIRGYYVLNGDELDLYLNVINDPRPATVDEAAFYIPLSREAAKKLGGVSGATLKALTGH